MADNELTALIAVLFALLSTMQLAALVLGFRRFGDVLGAAARPVMATLDTALAPLGEQLKPIHSAAEVLESLIDAPTDLLYTVLPAALRETLLAKLREIEALTDGKAIPVAEDDQAIQARLAGAAFDPAKSPEL